MADTIAISAVQQINNLKNFGYAKDILLQAIAEVYGAPQERTDNFKTWKKISLGTGLKTADDFRRALKADGHVISDWGDDILSKPAFTVVAEKTEVELIRLTVADLGFEEGTTRTDIYNRATELGLALCPAEVGPQLRLQYQDQPMNEGLFIAMKPILDSDSCLSVFGVGRTGGGLWLNGGYGEPDGFWRGDNALVFLRCK
jgi:hypothetical protein